MINLADVPISDAVKMMTETPAKIIGAGDKGTLDAGKDADIVIWTADPITTVGAAAYVTIVDGKTVYQA